jgi:hypothetical protein
MPMTAASMSTTTTTTMTMTTTAEFFSCSSFPRRREPGGVIDHVEPDNDTGFAPSRE